jgi:manganese transport protein
MEGYLNLRIQPWLRRLITRLMAVIPALLTILIIGEKAIGGLLILSQVILSIQLGFAVIPLIHFVSDKNKMGKHVISAPIKILAWMCAIIIVGLNAKMIIDQIHDWISGDISHAYIYYITVVPISIMAAILLLYITFHKQIHRKTSVITTPHGTVQRLDISSHATYPKIAITIDFSKIDSQTINFATKQGGKEAEYLLIHVVETAGAIFMGKDIDDLETHIDKEQIQSYLNELNRMGYNVTVVLGYGNPKKAIPELVKEHHADLLVMGAHGHRFLKDLIFGTTIDSVRHNVKIPVLIFKGSSNKEKIQH